jgi:hypothetical protein
LYRGINEFKKWYPLRINIIKDENDNLLADPQSVLNRWKNFFNQVLNVHGDHEIGQMDKYTAEPLVPEPRIFELEIAIGTLKCYKFPGTDHFPAKLFKARCEILYILIHNFICSTWIKEELPQRGRNQLLSQFIKGW